jgi:hypothetical protein
MASDHVTDDAKAELEAVQNRLNPFILKQAIERKLRRIFQHVKVTSNVRQRI